MELKWEACIKVLWEIIFRGVKTAGEITELKGKIYICKWVPFSVLFRWQAPELRRNTGKENRRGLSLMFCYLFRRQTMWEKIVTHRRQLLSLSRLAVMRRAVVPLAWVHKSAQSPLTGVLVGKSGPHSTFCTLGCHYVTTNTYLYWGGRSQKVCLSRSRTPLCLA